MQFKAALNPGMSSHILACASNATTNVLRLKSHSTRHLESRNHNMHSNINFHSFINLYEIQVNSTCLSVACHCQLNRKCFSSPTTKMITKITSICERMWPTKMDFESHIQFFFSNILRYAGLKKKIHNRPTNQRLVYYGLEYNNGWRAVRTLPSDGQSEGREYCK